MLNIEPGRVLRALLVVMLAFAFAAAVTITEISNFESMRVVSDQECSQRLENHVAKKCFIRQAESAAFDWFQAVWNLFGWTIGQPRPHPVAKAIMTVSMGFRDEDPTWLTEMKDRYGFEKGDMIDITLETRTDKTGHALADGVGGIYRVLSSDYHKAYVRTNVVFPDPDIKKVKVTLITLSPGKYRANNSDKIERDESGQLGTTLYSGTIEAKVGVEGSPAVVFEKELPESNDPYIFMAKPEGHGYNADSTALVMFYARRPATYARMNGLKDRIGDVMAYDQWDRDNTQLDKIRDNQITIFARQGTQKSDPIWTNTPTFLIQDEYKGKCISKVVTMPSNGQITVPVFSGKVSICPENKGGKFGVLSSSTVIIDQTTKDAEFLICPEYTKATLAMGKIRGRIQVAGKPGTLYKLKMSCVGGKPEKTGVYQGLIPKEGIYELEFWTDYEQEYVLVEAWKNGQKTPDQKIYFAQRSKCATFNWFQNGDPGTVFGYRTWGNLNGDPMFRDGSRGNDDFQSRIRGSSTFMRAVKAFTSRVEDVKRYLRLFSKTKLVKVDNGLSVWGLGFGDGFRTHWNQMVKVNLRNAKYVVVAIPDDACGWTIGFVVWSDHGPGCGNILRLWIPPTTDLPQPPLVVIPLPAPPNYPVSIDWMYAGDSGASMKTTYHNPNALPGWIPATNIEIQNENWQTQNQNQTSTNNNNNWNYNNNNNVNNNIWQNYIDIINNNVNQLQQILNNANANN